MAPHYNKEGSALSPEDLKGLGKIFTQSSEETPLLNSLKEEYAKVLEELGV